jgi:hypothetical protein
MPGKLLERQGYVTKTFQPPYVKVVGIASANEVFENKEFGKTLYESNNKSLEQRAMDLLAKDLNEFDTMLTRKEELMAAQLISTGILPIVGEGYPAGTQIDFGMPDDHTLVLTDTALWSNAASDPIDNIKTWKVKIFVETGYTPRDVVFSPEAWKEFLSHTKVKALLDLLRLNVGAIERKDTPEGATFYGNVEGVNLWTYDELYLDDWTDPAVPVEKPMVPAKCVIIGVDGSRTRHARHYGAILDLDAGLQAYRIFPKIFPNDSRTQLNQLIQSSPMLALHEPKSFMCIQVVA